MVQTGTTFYAVLRPFVRLGLRIFFRRVEVVGMKNIPEGKPVILVANHQNAMLDPLVLCVENKRQLHWLTRADVFRKPTVGKLLRKLNMLPVYRERDRVDDLSAYNKITFDISNARLKAASIICMFPEGTHRGKKQLVPLKKGVARLALNALDSGLSDICIVPVGIDYEDYYNYRKDLLIQVGEAIDLSAFQNYQESERSKAQTEIIRQVREGLESVMIDIENELVYDEAFALRPLFNKLSGKSSLSRQFSFYQKFIRALGKSRNELSDNLTVRAKDYLNIGNELHLSEKFYSEGGTPIGKMILLALLALPSLIGAMVYFPIYSFTEFFVRKTVRDPLFKNSIRAAFWTFITPLLLAVLWLLLLLIGCGTFINLAVILGLIACGFVALQWWPLWKGVREWFLHNKLKREKNRKYELWIQKRSELIQWINELDIYRN